MQSLQFINILYYNKLCYLINVGYIVGGIDVGLGESLLNGVVEYSDGV